jgi:hypothetical protein
MKNGEETAGIDLASSPFILHSAFLILNYHPPMPITVLSPFSGNPVKIRDQDLGRAVRDEAGRIFYVLEKPDGSGYYAAPTRAGGPKDFHRYAALESKTSVARDNTREQVEAVHDATGKRRGASGKLLVVIFLLILAALAWAVTKGPLKDYFNWQPNPAPQRQIPVDRPPTTVPTP